MHGALNSAALAGIPDLGKSGSAMLSVVLGLFLLGTILLVTRSSLGRNISSHVARQFSWRNRLGFAIRINARIAWLRFNLWWRQRSIGGVLRHLSRPLLVILAAGTILIAIERLIPGGFGLVRLGELLRGSEKPKWQDALVLIGAPVAFVLWAFRDFHVFQTLENQRKDVNLKEFQEIQMRAAGALPDSIPVEAREQLQIAALHQLRGFLRGEYGKAFRRPAFELLLAGHSAAMERTGLAKALADWREEGVLLSSVEARYEIVTAISKVQSGFSAIERERAGIVRDDWQAVFSPDYPFQGRRLDGISLRENCLLSRTNVANASLIGVEMPQAHLEYANLQSARLEGAKLIFAHLENANLQDAHLEGVDLQGANLTASSISGAQFDCALLLGAQFQRSYGGYRSDTSFNGAYLANANFEDSMIYHGQFRNAKIQKTIFVRTFLEFADFTSAEGTGSSFNFASLANAKFESANIQISSMTSADLTGTSFIGALLHDLDARSSTAVGSDFSGAQLLKARLDSIDLSRATLAKANLRDASLIDANLDRANLERAILANADLTGANLSNANLTQASMLRANFAKANMNGADLSSADLKGAKLAGASLIDAILHNTDLRFATYDDETAIGTDWWAMSAEQKAVVQKILQDLGASHVSEVPAAVDVE